MKKFLLFFFVFAAPGFTQITSDVIEPVTVFTNEVKEIFLPDLFYSENYDFDFADGEFIEVNYDAAKKKIKLEVKNENSAFDVFSVIKGSDTLSVPVIIRRNYPVTFRFPANKEFGFISVFGGFNDWNRKEFPLLKKGKFYERTVFLRAGNYQYKFFADGKEFCDPLNPDSVSNGMGGFNSVITIENKDKNKIFLHKIEYKRNAEKSSFKFFAENLNGLENNCNGFFVFLDNKLLPPKNKKCEDGFVTVIIDNDELKNAKRLRILAAGKYGKSNIQNVFLEDGKPASVSGKFDWRKGVIYSLMIDRFYDGDKSNSVPVKHDSLSAKANYMGGDLQGVLDKLKSGYFDSLGINVLWLSPVYDNPNKPYREYPPPHRYFTGYHGYWPVDFFGVDEHFGTLKLLKKTVSEAHKRGIKVLLDFVSNHAHIENPVYEKHRNWFGSLYLPDGRKNIRFWDEYRLTTWFEPYLPSFDYVASDEAVEFMTENAMWWLWQTGADGFRHDAVKHVPNKFWRSLTRKLKERGYFNVYQIGETFGSDELISSYVNNGQLNAQFNFNLYDAAFKTMLDTNRSFLSLLDEIETTFEYYGENNLMGNIMDSHDKNRFTAFADGDLSLDEWSAVEKGWNDPPKVDNPATYKKAELYYAYLFAVPGVPVIYYGSEFGMSGASDPDNRRMMRFGAQLNLYEKEMLKATSEIVKLRRKHSALNYGDFFPLLADKNVFVFLRSDFNESILVTLNKNFKRKEKIIVNFPQCVSPDEIENLKTGETISVNDNRAEIELSPLGWSYFKIKLQGKK